MITLIAAASLAAQAAPAANPHEQHGQQMPTAAHHEQHEGMKKDCCKDCCKDMAAKHEGHDANHAEHSVR